VTWTSRAGFTPAFALEARPARFVVHDALAITGEDIMRFRRHSICTTALVAALIMAVGSAAAFDETKYPDLKGQWRRAGNAGLLSGGNGGLRYDASNPPARDLSLGQKPPLTPEYQAIYDANLADQAQGGQGIDPTSTCLSPGMPRVMIAYGPMEIVVTPGTTYILMERDHDFYRHIYTDGRDFPPAAAEPQYLGYWELNDTLLCRVAEVPVNPALFAFLHRAP
jgi:hypothetical protein